MLPLLDTGPSSIHHRRYRVLSLGPAPLASGANTPRTKKASHQLSAAPGHLERYPDWNKPIASMIPTWRTMFMVCLASVQSLRGTATRSRKCEPWIQRAKLPKSRRACLLSRSCPPVETLSKSLVVSGNYSRPRRRIFQNHTLAPKRIAAN